MGNVGVALLDALVLRLLFPAAGVAWAVACDARGWGVFNQATIPAWSGIVVSIAALDFITYAQHWLLHRIPLLWRMHLTHHTDQEIDFTTGLRFHPLEAVYTTSVRLAIIALLGLPPLGVLVAEIASLVVSFWEHANVRVPLALDRALRLLIVTPEVHRTHHSQDGRDNQSNAAARNPRTITSLPRSDGRPAAAPCYRGAVPSLAPMASPMARSSS